MNWAGADAAYNWAQQNGYKFKFHTFVWGSQFPQWLTNSGLTQAQQRAEIEQWMQLACQRYPNTWAIDVVNEPIKTPMPFTAALGGTGSTGWDWVITAFQLARQYCPNAKLLINEYGTENDPPVRNTYKTIINLLKTRGLIDGIGIQAHYFNIDNMNRSAVTTMLNDYATLALDVWVSELDIIGPGGRCGAARQVPGRVPGILGAQLGQGHHAVGVHRRPDLARRHGPRDTARAGAARDGVAQELRGRHGRRRYAGAECTGGPAWRRRPPAARFRSRGPHRRITWG